MIYGKSIQIQIWKSNTVDDCGTIFQPPQSWGIGKAMAERIQEYHPPDDRSGWTVPTDFWGMGVIVTIVVTRDSFLV